MQELPTTPWEWIDLATSAEGLLILDSARQYGLLTGGPEVNAEQCQHLLSEARRRGYHPRPSAAEEVAAALARSE